MGNTQAGGKFLLQARRQRHWTQAQAAREINDRARKLNPDINIPPQELSRLELGQTKTPSMETLVAVGDAYGLTPNQVAEAYGYWESDQRNESWDAGWVRLRPRFHQLSHDARSRVLLTMETLIQGEATIQAMDDKPGSGPLV